MAERWLSRSRYIFCDLRLCGDRITRGPRGWFLGPFPASILRTSLPTTFTCPDCHGTRGSPGYGPSGFPLRRHPNCELTHRNHVPIRPKQSIFNEAGYKLLCCWHPIQSLFAYMVPGGGRTILFNLATDNSLEWTRPQTRHTPSTKTLNLA